MCLLFPRARVTVLLAALLLPVCALAEPLRLQLTPFASEVPATVKELQPKLLEERTRHGLQQALKKNTPNEFELLPANSPSSADIFVTGKVSRQGSRYRITYSLQANGPNRAQSSLNYDFAAPRLAPKGVVVMARDLLDEARKLGQARPAAPVASATPPPAAALEATTASPASPATAPAAQAAAPLDTAPAPQDSPPPAQNPSAEGLPTPRRYSRPPESTPGDAPRRSAESSERYGDADPDRGRGDADAEDDLDSRRHVRHAGETQLDIGASTGFNSPAGIYGGELEYRPFSRLGLNLSAGNGALGARLGPLVRLYPFGHVIFSPFLEAGMSFNLGYTTTGTDENGNTQPLTFPVTYAFTGCIGSRIALGPYVYLTPRAGWAQPLNAPIPTFKNGSTADGGNLLVYLFSLQAGFVASLSVGVSPF